MNNFFITSTDMSIQLKMMFCSFFFCFLFASYKIVPFEREYEKKMKRKEKQLYVKGFLITVVLHKA